MAMKAVVCMALMWAAGAFAQQRPPITGVATFAVKVSDMEAARNF
jgi:hypothetical protein